MLSISPSFAQDHCEKVYSPENVDVKPVYENSEKDLIKVTYEIAPVLKKYYNESQVLVTKIILEGIITHENEFVKLKVLYPKSIPKNIVNEMEQKLNSTEKWKAGILKQQKVCTKIVIPIGCIKWNI